MTRWRLVLDTDIGSDVDDALALAMLLSEPEVELLAVTTAYGDTALRARIARRVCQLGGRPGLPIVPGRPQPLSDRPVSWSGHEGVGVTELETAQIDDHLQAPEVLAELAQRHRGDLEVAAIGPLTNIAVTLLLHPSFAKDVARLWVMGGDFSQEGSTEHNFKCDPLAAWIVLHSGIPMTICGLEITSQVRLGPPAADALASQGAIGALLADQMRRWWQVSGRVGGSPHDPVALLTRLAPKLFEFAEADVAIVGDGPRAGSTRARFDPGSSIRIVTSVRAEAAHQRIFDGLFRRPG